MKKAWKTTEFWGALITNLVGIAMIFGVIGAEEGEEIGNAAKAIAGALLSLGATFGYIKERGELKKSSLATISNLAISGTRDPVTSLSVEQSKRLIQEAGV